MSRMETQIKILVVEDEMIIGAKISLQLTNLGYEVTGILPRGEDVFHQLEVNQPDIILLDINLKGKLDGIETAKLIIQKFDIPIIFLTANSDEATFNKAKSTKPAAFISKPFKQLDLQRAIELTVSRFPEFGPKIQSGIDQHVEESFIINDRIFVRHKDRFVKILFSDILYIEADRNYSHIFTKNKEFVLSLTLKSIEEKLPGHLFQRIHRSHVVNICQVDEVAEGHVMIGNKLISMSEGFKENLLLRIQKL